MGAKHDRIDQDAAERAEDKAESLAQDTSSLITNLSLYLDTGNGEESPYTLRRIKSVLGKAGAMFGELGNHFAPVYATLLGEVANETVPECVQALEEEIRAIEQHANEMIDALKAKLISTINTHLQKVSPKTLNALYPQVDPKTAPMLSPIALNPVTPVQPASDVNTPQVTTPNEGNEGI